MLQERNIFPYIYTYTPITMTNAPNKNRNENVIKHKTHQSFELLRVLLTFCLQPNVSVCANASLDRTVNQEFHTPILILILNLKRHVLSVFTYIFHTLWFVYILFFVFVSLGL